MNNKKVEMMFWRGNEAIHWGTQTKIIFENENQAESFLAGFTCEGCTDATVDVYIGNRCINSYSYSIEVA